MDKIRIHGGKTLKGTVKVSGSKNAALPILISGLLAEGKCTFKQVPQLQDIKTTLGLLSHLGVEVNARLAENQVDLDASQMKGYEAPYDLVRKMRASVVVLGPLLARFGKAKVSLPGGCAIGARPINYHLSGLEKLGAHIDLEDGYVIASAKRLKGNRVAFEFPSVGATENVLMAATLAEGESLLENCAREPEVVDLAVALRAMGAEIEGEGTEVIRVQGKSRLQGCTHTVVGDRIEAGTFLIAGLITGGKVCVEGVEPALLESVLVKLEDAGGNIVRGDHFVSIECGKERLRSTDVTTLPYPGFPTDMQAQFMSAMTIAQGASMVTETIFENRFMHVSELARLGADITVKGHTAWVKGQSVLKGAQVMATDLRASASLILAGLCAHGETTVNRIYHLDRGYERMEEKLRLLGAEIERVV